MTTKQQATETSTSKQSTLSKMKEKVTDLAHDAVETGREAVQKGRDVLKGQKGKDKTSTTETDLQAGEKRIEAETKTSTTAGFSGPRTNRGVVFKGDGKVEVKPIAYPEMKLPWNGQPINSGCIVRVLLSGICGTDMHPFHGRTGMKEGMVIGHEVLGEVVEVGEGVQFTKVGDWGAVSATISCGTCTSCKMLRTEACMNTNPERNMIGEGGLYGFANSGDWPGGQAEYMFVPYCDYNFFKFPDKEKAKSKLMDLLLITDVLCTGYHGTEEAKVKVGSNVFIAGAGPVGLCAAACCNLKGAANIIVMDSHPERLELAKLQGCFTINLSEISDAKALSAKIKEFTGCEFVDCAIDCVGYEAKGLGSKKGKNDTCCALDNCIQVCKPSGYIGVLGVYPPKDPKGPDSEAKEGFHSVALGKAWMKGLTITTGPLSIMKYIEQLYRMIMADKLPIAKLLNMTPLPLDQAAEAYSAFSQRAAKKFVLDPFNTLALCPGNGATSCDKSGCTDRSMFQSKFGSGMSSGMIDKSKCMNKECTKDTSCQGANCGQSLPSFGTT